MAPPAENHFSIRIFLPLAAALCAFAVGITALLAQPLQRWFKKDLRARSALTALAVRGAVDSQQPLSSASISHFLNKLAADEQIAALALCSNRSQPEAASNDFPAGFDCNSPARADKLSLPGGRFVNVVLAPFQSTLPSSRLVLLHDASFIEARVRSASLYVFSSALALALVVSFITLGVANAAMKSRLAHIAAVIRARGSTNGNSPSPQYSADIEPVLEEVESLVHKLESATTKNGTRILWSPRTLTDLLERRLNGGQVITVSNREPYIHVREDDRIVVQIPASGLVTALEPIMRACSGTWIAHGGGSADRETADDDSRLRVPPLAPSYTLRRVWLTSEEEQGYYYGFSNEGLWPLCHIAHTRPIFRKSDWELYIRVNRMFAEAVAKEAISADPIVFVQDYHFALLPRLIKQRLPQSTIITFWHIPWPNPEAFGICPWRQQILSGLLGSTILGFHTRFHVNNFLETTDRFMEARIDREHGAISHRSKLTAVRSYPISIDWEPAGLQSETAAASREEVCRRLNLPSELKIAVGVDRLDYTKGILERLAAIETFLADCPHWRSRFVFIQLAAPSRSKLDSYRFFQQQVRESVERINARCSGRTPAVILLERHHEPEEVFRFLRAADVCLVTSLHDGMNLVAKEFVVARTDALGVLILSMFTGASKELSEALIVNPYNTEQCARAIEAALEMPIPEQQARMKSMREQVRDFNVYRWAGRMLTDALDIREREEREANFIESGGSGFWLPLSGKTEG